MASIPSNGLTVSKEQEATDEVKDVFMQFALDLAVKLFAFLELTGGLWMLMTTFLHFRDEHVLLTHRYTVAPQYVWGLLLLGTCLSRTVSFKKHSARMCYYTSLFSSCLWGYFCVIACRYAPETLSCAIYGGLALANMSIALMRSTPRLRRLADVILG